MSKKELVSKFIQFLNDELKSNHSKSEEFTESLEVARQCLETAYEIDASTIQSTSPNLLELLDKGSTTVFNVSDIPNREATHEEKERADKLKTQGNSCMSKELYTEAIECYSKAIEINPRNAVFYCNRAAAYSKRQDHELAIKDCERALTIDANYCKAYARMAFAYLESSNYPKSIEYYKKALEYEPNNEAYQQQLMIAETHARGGGRFGGVGPGGATSFAENTAASGSSPGVGGINPAAAGFPAGLGNLDFSSFLNNPALMNMATQMLSSPQMQSMMSNLISGANTAPSSGQGLDSFLQMGQQMASQMQQSNPEMVDLLRNRFHNPEPNPNNIDNNVNNAKNDINKDKQPPGDADKDHQPQQ